MCSYLLLLCPSKGIQACLGCGICPALVCHRLHGTCLLPSSCHSSWAYLLAVVACSLQFRARWVNTATCWWWCMYLLQMHQFSAADSSLPDERANAVPYDRRSACLSDGQTSRRLKRGLMLWLAMLFNFVPMPHRSHNAKRKPNRTIELLHRPQGRNHPE